MRGVAGFRTRTFGVPTPANVGGPQSLSATVHPRMQHTPQRVCMGCLPDSGYGTSAAVPDSKADADVVHRPRRPYLHVLPGRYGRMSHHPCVVPSSNPHRAPNLILVNATRYPAATGHNLTPRRLSLNALCSSSGTNCLDSRIVLSVSRHPD